jgi:hypothetical protein
MLPIVDIFSFVLLLLCLVVTIVYIIFTRKKEQFVEIKGYYLKTKVASTKNINLKDIKHGLIIDGIIIKENDRVLLKDQDKILENGIYKFNNNELKRVSDLKRNSQIVVGAKVYVEEGKQNGNQNFVLQVLNTNKVIDLQEITVGIVFIKEIDKFLGSLVSEHDQAILVSDKNSIFGASWKPLKQFSLGINEEIKEKPTNISQVLKENSEIKHEIILDKKISTLVVTCFFETFVPYSYQTKIIVHDKNEITLSNPLSSKNKNKRFIEISSDENDFCVARKIPKINIEINNFSSESMRYEINLI